jgi:hypothetical protein
MDFVGCRHRFSVVHGALRPPSPLHRSGRPAWSRLSWPINEVGGSLRSSEATGFLKVVSGRGMRSPLWADGYPHERTSASCRCALQSRYSGIGQTKPSRSALRISAVGRQPRFRPATGAPVAAAFGWSAPPATRREGWCRTKKTSGIRARRLNVHITEWTGGKGANRDP